MLTLYGRHQCHLCEEMVADLRRWRGPPDLSVQVVYVDGQPELEDRFGAKVPVLTEGEHEICYYFLDYDALSHHLAVLSRAGD